MVFSKVWIWIRVSIDVSKPLQRLFSIKRSANKDDACDRLDYERLLLFFHCCGRLGHGKFKCDYPESAVSNDGKDFVKQYGVWLRASSRMSFNSLGSSRDLASRRGSFVGFSAIGNLDSSSFTNPNNVAERTRERGQTSGLGISSSNPRVCCELNMDDADSAGIGTRAVILVDANSVVVGNNPSPYSGTRIYVYAPLVVHSS